MHRGCASEEPDEGNLQVRFCEGAHSNLGAIILIKGALWALLDINADLMLRFLKNSNTKTIESHAPIRCRSNHK